MEWVTGLILGSFLLWLGSRGLKRPAMPPPMPPDTKEIQDLRRALQESQKAIKLLEQRFRQHRELDVIVVLEAEQRENRAKAALTAVLQQNGCTESQIQGVLSKIDRPEDD